MTMNGIARRLGLLVGVAALIAILVAGTSGAQDSEQDGAPAEAEVLRIGWAQDPQTLNPFVALDEENYNVWALTWELLVGFSQEDLSPAPAIAESWEVSDDGRTVTFKLADRTWSDGEPVTSEDVRYSLEVLGEEGDLFAGYTSAITSVETPDDETVIVKTKEPDARIVGGLFLYILPEHIWGAEDLDDLTSSFQPELPMVGSGPYIVTEFERGRIIRMERNPEWQGPEPGFDEVQYIKYGNQDGVERALRLGEVDMVVEVADATFSRLADQPNIETLSSPEPSYTQLAFNLCPEELCPDAKRNPALEDRTVRQAIGYAIDRERINEIAAHGTSFVGHGILPSYYKSFYSEPEQDYPYDPELANQMLDDAGWERDGSGARTKDGEELAFGLLVRSESQYNIQAARLVAEMAAEIGVEFDVQVVSVDKLTELTVREVDGEPAPEFDTFIWGWGGDPYDPSFLLSLLTTEEIGGLSDAFYSNPEYDALYEQQARTFDTAERKALVEQMIAITQEDLPYLVLTEDPNLQAYRTDRIGDIEPVCPAGDGDLICEQVSFEPLLSIGPADGESSNGGDGGGPPIALLAIGGVLLLGIGAVVVRSRRRRSAEPLELEE